MALSKVTASSVVSPQTIVGIELEYEGISRDTSNALLNKYALSKEWEAHEDNSLRPRGRNAEFTLCDPTPAERAAGAVRGLTDLIAKWNSGTSSEKFGVSWRTGLHIHVDFRRKPAWQVHNALIIGSFLDPLIFDWDAHGRQESKFCLAANRTDSLLEGNNVVSRYSSINAQSLMRYGSLEFRHAQSTVEESKILGYLNIVLGINKTAYEMGDNSMMLLDSLAKSVCLQQWCATYLPDKSAKELCSIKNSHPGKYVPNSDSILAGIKYTTINLDRRV